MDLQTFQQKYDDFTQEARDKYLYQFFERVLNDTEKYEDFILDCIGYAVDLEGDDYFDTEGFKFI